MMEMKHKRITEALPPAKKPKVATSVPHPTSIRQDDLDYPPVESSEPISEKRSPETPVASSSCDQKSVNASEPHTKKLIKKQEAAEDSGHDLQSLRKDGETDDRTNAAATRLRRQVYLALMSAMASDEASHKIIGLSARGNISHMVHYILESCEQAKSYENLYGQTAQRLCKAARGGPLWTQSFENEFVDRIWPEAHDLSTQSLRIVGDLYGDLLAADAVSWSILSVVVLQPDESTPSTRILLQSLLSRLRHQLGLSSLQRRLYGLRDGHTSQMLPSAPQSAKFATNFFVAIGLGAIAEPLRMASSSEKPALAGRGESGSKTRLTSRPYPSRP